MAPSAVAAPRAGASVCSPPGAHKLPRCTGRLCDGVRHLLTARCDQLGELDFVAELVRAVGLVPDFRGCRLYGQECGAAVPGHDAVRNQLGMYQDPVQLGSVLRFLRSLGVETYLEVGINGGWTSCFVAAYLLRHSPSRRLTGLAVDKSDRRVPSTKELFRDLNISFARRSTPSALRDGMYALWPHLATRSTAAALHARDKLVDLCFIDGDHSYAGVRLDYEMAAPHCRIVMFHDVSDWDSFDQHARQQRDGQRGVPGFWAHLKANVARSRIHEFTSQAAVYPPTLGIGLVLPGASGTAEIDTPFTTNWTVGGALGKRWGVAQEPPPGFSCVGCSSGLTTGIGSKVAAPPGQAASAVVRSAVASRLNARFRVGRPSNDVEAAGVLYRGFDALSFAWSSGWRRQKRSKVTPPGPAPWLTDPYFRKEVADRFSASVMNARLPYFFPSAGFVIAPAIFREAAMCAFPEDVSSVNRTCDPPGRSKSCVPGCVAPGDPAWTWCQPSAPYRGAARGNPQSCAWRADQLEHVMRLHESRKDAASFRACSCCSWPKCPLYNEVLLDASIWEARLPATIEAICFPAGSRQAEADARQVHALFSAQFPQVGSSVPLLRLDANNLEQPFTLADPPT